MKKLMQLLLLCLATVPAMAQTQKSNILVYKLDGKVDTLLLNNVLDVYHSRRDVNGVEQPDISTLRLRTIGGERVYPLTEIDHVVMPKFGRIISFMGTTQPDVATNGARRTSVYTEDMLDASASLYYKWNLYDRIWLANGDKSEPLYRENLSENNRLGQFNFRSDSLIADQYVVYYPGSNATLYNKVTIPTVQKQSSANNSDHIGSSGDCGTAIAVRQANSNYRFSLNHKTAILSFIPRYGQPDVINTLQLKQVAVKSANGEKLAGTFTLSPDGLVLDEGTGSDSITLQLNSPFLMPQYRIRQEGMAMPPQDSVATFVVVAPQAASTALNVYYSIRDTKTQIDTVVPKTVTINPIQGAYIYPVTHAIPLGYFQAAMTDSVHWAFDSQPTLYGSVNLATKSSESGSVGFIWGYNKKLTDANKQADIPLAHSADLTFQTTLPDNVEKRAYYYRAYAKDVDHEGNAKTFWGKVKKFGMEREIIDLGTSVRWSSINMGSITAEDRGNYYAWGDTVTKQTYTEGNYKFYNGSNQPYTNIGSDIAGNPAYDVVAKEWRGCWRMPTTAELAELYDNTKTSRKTVTRVNEDGVSISGVLFTGKGSNPDSIFVPKAGYYSGSSLQNLDDILYWSSTEYNNKYAYRVYNGPNNWTVKYHGLPIRPVFESNYETAKGEFLFIRTDYIDYSDDQTEANLYGTMRGLDDVVNPITQGFVVGSSEEVTKDNALVSNISKPASDNGSYNILLDKDEIDKQTMGTKYYVRAYMDYDGNTYYGDAVEMVAMEIHTDSTNWEVGMEKNARLCGTAKGISAGMLEHVELGFVAGFTPDVELLTAHDTLVCDSTVNGKFVCLLDTIELKQYYYRAYLKNKLNGHVFYADLADVKMLGLEYIDLGLPSGLRWANINVGSQTPINNGQYFAWGEVKPDTRYDQTGYSYYQNNAYVNIGNLIDGTYDINGTTYDAAQVIWQGAWRMPTKADAQELIDNCNWERTTLYGKDVYKLTSKKNDNVIYLPCAGYTSGGNANVNYDNQRTVYRTSTMKTDNHYVWTIDNNANNYNSNALSLDYNVAYWRYDGYPVRPVAMVNDTLDDKSQIMLTTDSVQWEVGRTTATLHGYLLGLRYHTKAEESGFVCATTPNVTNETAGVIYLRTNNGVNDAVANGHFTCEMTGITDNTIYYYRAYVKVDGKYYFANEREFGRKMVELIPNSGVYWSNINLGASSPDDSGDYYAWGETTAKTSFNKPNTYPDLGTDIAGSSYDAAHVNWQGLWRMPTRDDVNDLLAKCTWTEVTKYGQPMYKVVGPSGDSIFIAKRGSINGVIKSNDGTRVSLWTSNLCTTEGYDKDNAYGTTFYGSNRTIDVVARYMGYTVRPIVKYNQEHENTKFYLTTDSTDWYVGNANPRLVGAVVGLDNLDADANVTVTRGFVVGCDSAKTALVNGGMNVTNLGDEENEVSVSGNVFRANIAYTKDTTYYYRAYVKIGEQYYYGNIRRYGLELVDMGSGVKWASLNLGAQISSDFGDRYAWGETNTKSTYTQQSYSYYDGAYQNLGPDISDKSSYDAVKANWTGTWRMPTNAEMNWLVENCDWTWTTEDGVSGYRVVSKTEGCVGNSIFLPAAGYQEGSYYTALGTDCYYWTSTKNIDSQAYFLHGDNTTRTSLNGFERFYGLSVRPVTKAGTIEGGGEGSITGQHKRGGVSQTGGSGGNGSGWAGTGNTGSTIGD